MPVYRRGRSVRRSVVLRARNFLAVAALGAALGAQPLVQRPLRPLPEAVAAAPAELVEQLRADAFTYFRFINRAWTARVCEAFADVTNPTIVRLHGDAHVEQFAVTQDAWGLADFDDSAPGPIFVDVVRFLGSLDLVARERGWIPEREALWDRFFDGYRRGLYEPDYHPPAPDVVRHLRQQAPSARDAYLAWGENQMRPMDEAQLKAADTAMAGLDQSVRGARPNLAAGYFTVVRAGWLRMGVGSAFARKVLIRIQGPTTSPDDDQLIEAKEVANLAGLPCLEDSTAAQAVRVIDGTRQLGRFTHDVLAVGPPLLMPSAAGRKEHWIEWWVSSWEPSYRELHVSDLRSADDLAEIAFDAGLQLGAGKLATVRQDALSSLAKFESRLRKETSTIVEELLAGWREFKQR